MSPYLSISYGQCSNKYRLINQTLTNALRNFYDEFRSQIKLGNELSEELSARFFLKDVASLLPFLKYMLQKHYKRRKGSVKECE